MLFVVEDIGMRSYQEDYHSVKLNLYQGYDYVAIFDGHGGHQVSEYMRFHLKDYVRKHLAMGKRPSKALKDAFEDANESLPIDSSYMTGSAVVVILRKDQDFWVANAGDSRAIMSSRRRPIALSIDHKPHREDELERIQQLGGKVTFSPNDVPRVQGNLALSRSVGDKYLYPYVICDPEIKHVKADQHNKYIIMATDGLWDALGNQEVVNIVDNILKSTTKNTKTLMHDVNYALLNEARQRGSQDNTTIIFWML